jgi:hypothetical protein
LFHLLVPGGKWHTEIRNPVSLANRCSSTFHSVSGTWTGRRRGAPTGRHKAA